MSKRKRYTSINMLKEAQVAKVKYRDLEKKKVNMHDRRIYG